MRWLKKLFGSKQADAPEPKPVLYAASNEADLQELFEMCINAFLSPCKCFEWEKATLKAFKLNGECVFEVTLFDPAGKIPPYLCKRHLPISLRFIPQDDITFYREEAK